jgi:hypothetical protein
MQHRASTPMQLVVLTQYSAVQCNAVPCSAVQCNAVPCSAVNGDRVSTTALASKPRAHEGVQGAYQLRPQPALV